MAAEVLNRKGTKLAMGYVVLVHTSARTGQRTAYLAPPMHDPARPRAFERVTAQAFDVLRAEARAQGCDRIMADGPNGWEEVAW